MPDNRDDFSSGVKGILAHRAGSRCSKPSCRALTAGPSSEAQDARSNVGVAAHITGASPGGARFDPVLASEERRSVSNGIWLCQTHAKEIDDDAVRFTAVTLRAWKQHAEEEARALLGRPISAQSLDVSIQVSMHRATDDSLTVAGSTNLPNGTKLFVELHESRKDKMLGQLKVVLNDGMFAASGFMNCKTPHHPGWYTVEVLAYFNGPWQQPDAVLDIVGKEGEYLVGRFAEPLHPELSESEKRFRASFDCVAPLLAKAPAYTEADLQRAIDITQKSVLIVDARKSACPIFEVVEDFMSSPGLRRRDGWTASSLSNGAILVGFNFWNADTPAVAQWMVIPETGEVRYQNLHAKYMSWAPDY